MFPFKIIFYTTQNNKQPVREFISAQKPVMLAEILREIDLLSEYGNALKMPHSKPLEDGIFELRIKASSGISRVLYFFYVDKQIILTNAFIKKTQKTPREEIEKAKKYKKDFLNKK